MLVNISFFLSVNISALCDHVLTLLIKLNIFLKINKMPIYLSKMFNEILTTKNQIKITNKKKFKTFL